VHAVSKQRGTETAAAAAKRELEYIQWKIWGTRFASHPFWTNTYLGQKK